MIQPNLAPLILADQLALGQGFLSRVLVAQPASLQGQRFQRNPPPWARAAIRSYGLQIEQLLAREPRKLGDNELDPAALCLDGAARQAWCDFADNVERELADEDQASGTRGLRNKIPEMALRLAGVLACLDDRAEIDLDTITRGIILARFNLSEAERLYQSSATSPAVDKALKLLRWLRLHGRIRVSVRDIVTAGPNMLRDAESAKTALELLVKHGLCRIDEAAYRQRGEIYAVSPHIEEVF